VKDGKVSSLGPTIEDVINNGNRMKQTTHHNATSYQCYKYFNIKRKGYCLKDISALQRKIGTKRETKNKTLLLPSTLDTSPT